MLHQTDAANFSCRDIRKEMDFAKTYSSMIKLKGKASTEQVALCDSIT